MTSTRGSKKRGRKPRSKGLGDTIEKATKATGVKKLVKWISGEDCGCDKRKEKLNKLFPYRKTSCLTEAEYHWLVNFGSPNQVTSAEQKRLVSIYNRVFNDKREVSSCGKCVAQMINDLRGVLKEYEN